MSSNQSATVGQRTEKYVEVSRSCPERIYVETCVPEYACSVSRVTFVTVSHDQGYSDNVALKGTYQGSCTWFIAAVITPGGHDRVPRRILQYNVHASSKYQRHEIVWNADSEDVTIRDWTSSIRAGDIVQVIPKAQYAGWINYVKEATIEISYTAIVRPADFPIMEALKISTDACYQTLDNDTHQIRLIQLHPGTYDKPLLCSLAYTSLQGPETASFEALSYCWGDLRKQQSISLTVSSQNGILTHELLVTEALHTALKYLRTEKGSDRVLWVDAICINQTDVDERSSQVSRMGEIYRKASRVVVWLGEGNKSTAESLQTINVISERYKRFIPEDVSQGDLAKLHDPLMESLGSDTFVDNWQLFEASWFRRTWVIQEIFNADSTIIYCGKDNVSWPILLRVNKCINLVGMKANNAYRALMPPIYQDLFDRKIATEDTLSTDTGILQILIKGLDLDATDPRDKIFAMLQFGKETRHVSLLPPSIAPDYQKSIKDVFSSFTKWWIVEHKSLLILSAIQALEGRTWQETYWDGTLIPKSELPSWSWGYNGHSNWAIGLLGVSISSPYKAAGHTKPDIDLILASDPSILPLTGIRIGIIGNVAPYPYYALHSSHESLHRAYVGIFDPLNLTGKWANQLGSMNTGTYITNDDGIRMQNHYRSHYEFSRKTNAVECLSDCFFSSPQGLVGLCPFSARPGDLLVILHGGSVPYVIRAQSDNIRPVFEPAFEFIGECYIEGYMEGDRFKELMNDGIESETFNFI